MTRSQEIEPKEVGKCPESPTGKWAKDSEMGMYESTPNMKNQV